MAKYEDVLYHSTSQPTALRGVAERIRKDGRRVYDARIGYASGKNKHIGTFWTAEAAALAWDVEARLKRGKEALTNFPEEYAATRGSPWAFKVPANKAEAARMLELGSTLAAATCERGTGGLWRNAAVPAKPSRGNSAVSGPSSPESNSTRVERKSRSERQRLNCTPLPASSKGGLLSAVTSKGAVETVPSKAGPIKDKVPRKVRTREGKRKIERTINSRNTLLNNKGDCDYGKGRWGDGKMGEGGGGEGLVSSSNDILNRDGDNRDGNNRDKEQEKWSKEKEEKAEEADGRGSAGRQEKKVLVLGTAGGGRKKGSGRRKRSEKKYKGITKRFTAKGETVWHVQIVHQGKCLHLGTVRDPVEGAVIWDTKARELRGINTETNFPLGFVPPFLLDCSPASNGPKASTPLLRISSTRRGAWRGAANNHSKVDGPENVCRTMARAEESEGGSQYWENGGHACTEPTEEDGEDAEVTGGRPDPEKLLLATTKSPQFAGIGILERRAEEGEVRVGGKSDGEEEDNGRRVVWLGKEEGRDKGVGLVARKGVVTRKVVVGEWEDGEGDDKWEWVEDDLEWDKDRTPDSDANMTGSGGQGGVGPVHMTEHVGVFEKQVDVATIVFEVWVGLGASKKRCLGTFETETEAQKAFQLEQRRVIEHMLGAKRAQAAADSQGKSKRFKLLSSLP